MLNFIKEKLSLKKVTVEQIHAEFDSGQERILAECNEILRTLNIIPESHIERKGKMLAELGFVNSETTKQLDMLKSKNKEIEKQKMITQAQAEVILYFKHKYPYSKFITVDELNRICDKYGLIHAPVGNYIKDVPEKNVLEIANRIVLDPSDSHLDNEYIFKPKTFHNEKERSFFKKKEYTLFLNEMDANIVERRWFAAQHIVAKSLDMMHILERTGSIYKKSELTKVSKKGLFIAAPPSHFNLKGLSKKSPFGYFNVESFEVNDPVVFEYCKNNVVRIITKWGTDDDQSYLDPSLTNESMN